MTKTNEYTFISVRLQDGVQFTKENISLIWSNVRTPEKVEFSQDIVDLSNSLGYHVVCSSEENPSDGIMKLPFVKTVQVTNTFTV